MCYHSDQGLETYSESFEIESGLSVALLQSESDELWPPTRKYVVDFQWLKFIITIKDKNDKR